MATIAEVRQQYPQYSDMSDADLAGALHSKFYAEMPKDEFAKKVGVTPTFSERFSGEPKPAQQQQSISDVVTDIPKEIGAAYTQGAQHLTGNSVNDLPGYDARTRGQLGPVEGLLRTGKQLLGLPEIAMSPIVGAARSIGGHLMAQGEHAIGSVIAPDIAAKDDPQKMYEAAKGDIDTALSAGRPGKVPVKAAVPATIAELKKGATANYEGPALTDLQVKPTAITDFASKAKITLDTAGLDENLAPKTHAILTRLETPPDGPSIVTGKNIMSLRKLLGNAAGEPGQEGLAASKALRALDEHIPNIASKDVIAGDPKAAGEALDTANADYSAAKHAETIDNKTIRAELRAAASNSGHNVANTIRQRMADILNPERSDLQRGFQPDELAAMEQIVRGTKTQNALRWAGNYLGGGGGLGALHTSGIGAGIGATIAGPVGAAIGAVTPPAIGYLLKAMGNRGTLADAAKLSEMIRSRAPLSSSMQKFEESAQALSAGKTSRTYAAAFIAARNFSNNLKSAGVVNISPSDLMKGIESPSSASANEDQQGVPGISGQ